MRPLLRLLLRPTGLPALLDAARAGADALGEDDFDLKGRYSR